MLDGMTIFDLANPGASLSLAVTQTGGILIVFKIQLCVDLRVTVYFPDSYLYNYSLVATNLSGYDGSFGQPFLDDVDPVIKRSTNAVISPFQL